MVSCYKETWTNNLKRHGDYYSGFVTDLEEVLENHRMSTITTWGTRTSRSVTYQKKKVANDKENNVDIHCQVWTFYACIYIMLSFLYFICIQLPMLYWNYKFSNSVAKLDNTPFRIISTRYLDCQYGNEYYKDHEPKSKRVCLQSTRKLGCPAHMMIKEFEIYSQYKTNIDGMSTQRARSLKEMH